MNIKVKSLAEIQNAITLKRMYENDRAALMANFLIYGDIDVAVKKTLGL